MQEGGQPFGGNVVMPQVDDGSIGGFNRPELRGLRKQARRGTLTNRERRRLNYLTNEVKGRRRRGLLSGLGGAAAALGTAALIKSGGAKGLMDSIKSKMSGLKEGLETRKEEREIGREMKPSKEDRNIEMMKPLEATKIDSGLEERGIVGVEDNEAMMRQLQAERDLEESDRLTDEEQAEEAGLSGNIDEKAVGKQSFGKGQTYSTEDMLNALQNAKTPEDQQAILDKMGATGSTPNPKAMERLEEEIENTIGAKRGTVFGEPIDPDDPLSPKSRKPIMRGSKGPLNPDDFSLQQGEEVDLPSDTEQLLQGLSKGIDPAVLGAVRGGGGDSLMSKIDPEGLVQEGGEEGAMRILQALNEGRKQRGLPPVDKLTKEAIDEANMAAGPQRLKPLQAGPIESSVERPFGGTLPQLRAQQLLRGSKMNAGGMVKRMIERYN